MKKFFMKYQWLIDWKLWSYASIIVKDNAKTFEITDFLKAAEC